MFKLKMLSTDQKNRINKRNRHTVKPKLFMSENYTN